MKQDAAPTLACGNGNPQLVVGAVERRSVPLGAVQRRSVHPVAPNLLPGLGAATPAGADRLARSLVAQARAAVGGELTRCRVRCWNQCAAWVHGIPKLPIRSRHPSIGSPSRSHLAATSTASFAHRFGLIGLPAHRRAS